MLITLITVNILIFLSYVYIRWFKLKQYWAERQVPYIPPHPVCGNITFLLKENPVLWFRRMYNHCKHPYLGIWVFWRPGLLVNSPDIAKNILIRDQHNFRNRFASSGTTDPVGALNLFTLNDPLWTGIRRRLTVLFTSSKLRGVQNVVTEKSKQLVERIEKERQKQEPINTRSIMADYSSDIIGTASFGVVCNAVVSGTSPIKHMTAELMHFSLFRAMSWCCSFFIPHLMDFFRFKMYPTETVEFMRSMLREIISQRGGLEKKVAEPKDLLDILIKIKQDDEELEMTENMMLAQATIFLEGGFETTATLLTFLIYELAFCPTAQEILNIELQEAKEKYGDDLLDGNTLSQLTYLNCVINEGLRKYPIVSYLDRVALADYQVDEHVTIKAGTPVYVNVVGMHYDPEFFPEPEKFNPDRFLPENKMHIRPFSYMPFGEGPRKCVGQRFGLSSVRHGLTAIILNYELRPLPNAPKPIDIELEKSMLTTPETILSVEFVPKERN